MPWILLAAFCLVSQIGVTATGKTIDTSLSKKIERLFHTIVTTDDDSQAAAARADVREIYAQHGLPTVAQVGDEAAYEFVVLLASPKLPFEFRSEVLTKVEESASHQELPSDAAVFYAARLRFERIKKTIAEQPPTNPELRDQIERLSKIDQAVRQQEGFNADKLAAADSQNAAPLQAIFDRYGVPTYSMVGPQAAGDFVIMVQHQSPEFRERVLPELKANVDKDQADPDSYAKVYDRSQNDLGKMQLYGEQLVCNAGEQMHEAPIEDAAHVNQRRAELGLIRVELYARLAAELMPQFCPPGPSQK
jgi:hypothetical protein